MEASWGLHAESALGLLPGVPATTRSGDPSAPCLESGSCAVEKEESPIPGQHGPLAPPCAIAPGGMQVLTGLTCASLVSPAPRAHWGNSAAAPPGFLHLQGGSNATGETTREGFCLAFPPPSALLSWQGAGARGVGPAQSFPQHQQGFGSPQASPPFPMSPPREMTPNQATLFPRSSPATSSFPLRGPS